MREFDPAVASEISQWATQNLGQSYIRTALDLDRRKAGEEAARRSLRPLVEKAAREYGEQVGGQPAGEDVKAALDYVVEAYLTNQDGDYGGPRLERLAARAGKRKNPVSGERFYVIEKDPGEFYVADSKNVVRIMGGFTEAEAQRIADGYNRKGTVLKVANPQIREGQIVEEMQGNPEGDSEDRVVASIRSADGKKVEIPRIITHANMEPLLDALTREPEFQPGHVTKRYDPKDWYRRTVWLEFPTGELVGGGLKAMALTGGRPYQSLPITPQDKFNAQGLEGKVRVEKDLFGALMNLRYLLPAWRGQIVVPRRSSNPTGKRLGGFVARVSADEVSAFKSSWPASGLPSGYDFYFDFDSGGDLVDLWAQPEGTPYSPVGPNRTGTEQWDSPALAALSRDAQSGARGERINPVGDWEDHKARYYLPAILKSLELNGLFYDVMREHPGLSFTLRRHDDGDLTAAVKDTRQRLRGPEVVVPEDQIADVYHYALHHGTLEGWEPDSRGHGPGGRYALESCEETRRYRANPAGEAAAKYTEFHGRPPGEELVVEEEVHEHTHLAALGALVKIKVNCESGVKAVIEFERGEAEDERPILATSEDGKQLYIRGGDQSLDLDAIGMAGPEWKRDSMLIGEITDIEYETEKGFDNFDLITYYHRMGEDTKVRPYLVYDSVNGLLSIVGGQYEVKPEGIVN